MKKLWGLLALLLALASVLLFALRRRALAWVGRLPAPKYRIRVERKLRIPAYDGVILVADHYAPQIDSPLPTILIRTPYGRSGRYSPFGAFLAFIGRLFAERGYHVIIQDTRGRFESGGIFNPPFDETDDGLATLEWLDAQPWHDGKVGLWGPSYLGIVQWALAPHAPQVKAIMPMVTSSDLRSVLMPDDTLDLGLAMRWVAILDSLEKHKQHPYPATLFLLTSVEKQIEPAFKHLPLEEAEAVAVGKPVDYYRNWLDHRDQDDPLWRDLSTKIRRTSETPVHLVGGWYDFFLRGLLADYAALKEAGQTPYLTIGPNHHFNGMVSPLALREGLRWFDVHLHGNAQAQRERPVHLYIMGLNQWRALKDFPPSSRSALLYLGAGRALTRAHSDDSESFDSYVYDPADPTPILGGNQFNPRAGAKDNRPLERRCDVLTYTSDVLTSPVEIIGTGRLTLYAHSSVEHTDFFARLCDVYPDGLSINICDGFVRVTPERMSRLPDGTQCIEIDLWATAYHFKRGHRIRLLVASGAHPRWARNLGTGESWVSGQTVKVAQQTIYHDALHPSALMLPVTAGQI